MKVQSSLTHVATLMTRLVTAVSHDRQCTIFFLSRMSRRSCFRSLDIWHDWDGRIARTAPSRRNAGILFSSTTVYLLEACSEGEVQHHETRQFAPPPFSSVSAPCMWQEGCWALTSYVSSCAARLRQVGRPPHPQPLPPYCFRASSWSLLDSCFYHHHRASRQFPQRGWPAPRPVDLQGDEDNTIYNGLLLWRSRRRRQFRQLHRQQTHGRRRLRCYSSF